MKVQVSRNGICGTDLHEYDDGPIFVPAGDPHPLTRRCPWCSGVGRLGARLHRRTPSPDQRRDLREGQGLEQLRAGRAMKLLVDPTQ